MFYKETIPGDRHNFPVPRKTHSSNVANQLINADNVTLLRDPRKPGADLSFVKSKKTVGKSSIRDGV